MNKLILVSLLCLISFSFATESSNMKAFLRFIKEHDKSYKSVAEFNSKFEKFVENFEELKSNNSLYDSAENFNNLEFSPFMDMSDEEFANKRLSKIPIVGGPKNYFENKSNLKAADSFDWRTKGVINPIKDQGDCGSCWAFSAVCNMEAAYAIKHKTLKSFSEQQLVDCDPFDSGCDGGSMDIAFMYVQNEGLELGSDYPYKAKRGKCQASKSKYQLEVSDYKDIKESESEMKNVLFSHGPLSVAVNGTPFKLYKSGIFDPKDCNPKGLNHGVVVVGYGSENGKDYWIIRNSWSEKWGESGYIRLIRGKGACGVDKMVSVSEVK